MNEMIRIDYDHFCDRGPSSFWHFLTVDLRVFDIFRDREPASFDIFRDREPVSPCHIL